MIARPARRRASLRVGRVAGDGKDQPHHRRCSRHRQRHNSRQMRRRDRTAPARSRRDGPSPDYAAPCRCRRQRTRSHRGSMPPSAVRPTGRARTTPSDILMRTGTAARRVATPRRPRRPREYRAAAAANGSRSPSGWRCRARCRWHASRPAADRAGIRIAASLPRSSITSCRGFLTRDRGYGKAGAKRRSNAPVR